MPALCAADRAEAQRLRGDTRLDAIIGAPEAEGRQLAAFALAIRFDLSADVALMYLRHAPPLHTADAVSAWVAAIPAQPKPETRH